MSPFHEFQNKVSKISNLLIVQQGHSTLYGQFSIVIAGGKIPEWFGYQKLGRSISVQSSYLQIGKTTLQGKEEDIAELMAGVNDLNWDIDSIEQHNTQLVNLRKSLAYKIQKTLPFDC
ncbi:hypothetical protein KY284_014239 [Solanum tuberosum]|nr:hypothetical protein KY284_014239 [Solanum tuberosum]